MFFVKSCLFSMKIKKLIKILEKLDPEALVVLSSDAEGNSLGILDYVWDNCKFDVKNNEATGLFELTPEYIECGDTAESVGKVGKKAIVLYPK